MKVLNNDRRYEMETLAYKALKKKEGIVKCLGHWKIAQSSQAAEYHLLLEWGDYDLGEFFRLYPPLSTRHEIVLFWERFSCIVPALARIHKLETGILGDTWYG